MAAPRADPVPWARNLTSIRVRALRESQRRDLPLDGDEVADHFNGLDRPLVGVRPPCDLVEVVPDPRHLPRALALDLGGGDRPSPRARHRPADQGRERHAGAAFALARQSADSSGVRRTATRIGRRLAIGLRRHGGKGGRRPRPRNPPERGAVGDRRGGVPRQPPGYTRGYAGLPALAAPNSPVGAGSGTRRPPPPMRQSTPANPFRGPREARSAAGQGLARCRAIHVPPKPERRTVPPAPMSVDTGTSSAVGWINLTTPLLRRFASSESCCPSRFGDPKGGILRMWSVIGFIVAVQHSSPRARRWTPATRNGTDPFGNRRRADFDHQGAAVSAGAARLDRHTTGLAHRASRRVGRRIRVSIPVHGEARFGLCQQHESRQFPKGSSAVREPDRRLPAAPPSPPTSVKRDFARGLGWACRGRGA